MVQFSPYITKYLIKGGKVLVPSGFLDADVLIENDKIVAIGEAIFELVSDIATLLIVYIYPEDAN